MAELDGRGREKRTKGLASFAYTINNVFLLDSVAHRYLHIPLEPLAQSKPMIIIALSSDVQNPAHAKVLKFADMLFSSDLGP